MDLAHSASSFDANFDGTVAIPNRGLYLSSNQ